MKQKYPKKALEEKLDALEKNGVVFLDRGQVYIEPSVRIGAGTLVHPNVHLYGTTTIGPECELWPGVVVDNSRVFPGCALKSHTVAEEYSWIGASSAIGPDAHIAGRSTVAVHCVVGKSAQVIRSRIGPGTNAKHDCYIGDAFIGKNCNIAHDVTFCNFDGSQKHRTVLGDDIFVGSGVKLIAPLTLPSRTYIAANSVVGANTRTRRPGGLIIARGHKHTHTVVTGRQDEVIFRDDYVTRDEDGWYLGKRSAE